MGALTDIFNNVLSLFLQTNCPLCQRPAKTELCQYCQKQLESCKFTNPGASWQGDLPVFIWGMYGGQLKRTIAVMKYENHPELARSLGYLTGKAWLNSPISKYQNKLTVVPIPLHPNKQKQRGFNQAELLAKSFCEITGLPLISQGLQRIRETDAQFGLNAIERDKNLSEAFAINPAFKNRLINVSVLLLDDIYTTGATVRYAAKVLHQQGIKVYGIIAIASSKQTITKPKI